MASLSDFVVGPVSASFAFSSSGSGVYSASSDVGLGAQAGSFVEVQ